MKSVKGWWFTTTDMKLLNSDGRPIVLGETHKVEGEIVPCQHGLHLSKRLIDALQYSPGPVVYRVKGSGVIVPHGNPVDKYACSERTYLSGGVDVSDTLRVFARKCALDVINLWDAPEIVRRYLETGDESIRDAARSATRDAAWSAAWDDARSAAWAAAWAAAWDDARDAAGSAAWADAHGSAAWAAAWDDARDAARSATRDAAWDKQNKRLTAMISKVLH